MSNFQLPAYSVRDLVFTIKGRRPSDYEKVLTVFAHTVAELGLEWMNALPHHKHDPKDLAGALELARYVPATKLFSLLGWSEYLACDFVDLEFLEQDKSLLDALIRALASFPSEYLECNDARGIEGGDK